MDGYLLATRVSLATIAWLGLTSALVAQAPDMHYQHGSAVPPGAVGSWQLMRGGPLPGYFQPIEILGPEGMTVSMAADGDFTEAQPAPVKVGMLISPVYRLRVGNIPQHAGEEVFPTIEVVDRTYPPRGQAWRFPVPVELTEEDIELALEGKFVTRVIYLEDPANALPIAADANHQDWYDAGPGANPLQEADRLGRPVAILRMGGRVPNQDEGPDIEFLHGCPPFTVLRPRMYQEYEVEGEAIDESGPPADAEGDSDTQSDEPNTDEPTSDEPPAIDEPADADADSSAETDSRDAQPEALGAERDGEEKIERRSSVTWRSDRDPRVRPVEFLAKKNAARKRAAQRDHHRE